MPDPVNIAHHLCCLPSLGATLAERLYCAYNAGGDSATAGLNYAGAPCPVWAGLPANVRAKWEAVAALAVYVGAVPNLLDAPGRATVARLSALAQPAEVAATIDRRRIE